MAPPRIRRLDLESITPDDHGAVAVDFRPRRPFAFRAGQHALWLVPHGGLRPFTIASAPEEGVVTLGTSLASGSRLKRALGALAAGDPVRLLGPLSRFTLDGAAPAVVMLAQGMGVTPFRSMLRHLSMTGGGKDTTLVHVGREHPFRADTEALAGAAAYPVHAGEFTRALEDAVAAEPEATVMVSGSPPFVTATARSLRERGVSDVRRDTFWGYQGLMPGRRLEPVAA